MQLGFLEFAVQDVPAWTAFLTEVLGLLDVGDGRFRMDGHAWRFHVREGPADDLITVGWEMGEAEIDGVLARLDAADHDFDEAPASDRGARRRVCLLDPGGTPTELVTGLSRAAEPFVSPRVPGGFVADDQGLGHVVLTAPDKAASCAFYQDVLGFRLSDHVVCEFYGHQVDLTFFHVNARHHSLALGGPLQKRLHHFMVEARDVDQVGRAYDRTLASGAPIILTLGRHPNDRMLSFYGLTPSRFEFEFGWGGRQVDDATWRPATHDRLSDWGHHPPQVLAARRRS